MEDSLKIVKINTDENLMTAQRYQILAIPSLLVFKNGEEVERIVGFKTQDQLEAQLQKYLVS